MPESINDHVIVAMHNLTGILYVNGPRENEPLSKEQSRSTLTRLEKSRERIDQAIDQLETSSHS